MFTREGDPNDARGPSMTVQHAERQRIAAAAHLRECFPRAVEKTLELALDAHGGSVELAKDALNDFFRDDARGEGRRSRRDEDADARDEGRRRKRGRARRSRSTSRDGKGKREKKEKKEKREKREKRDRRSRSRSRSKEERVMFGNDEEERRRELANERERAEEARQKEVLERMRAERGQGSDVDNMREQELLRHKLQIAHKVGDAREVERLKALLSRDVSLDRAARANYGFRPND